MKQLSKLLGIGLAAFMAAGLVAAPSMAAAQSYRQKSSTHSEDGARTNAIALGAAGLILMNNHQKTLGAVALGAAALQAIQMQNDIKNRHDREDRYGYNTPHGIYSDGGYYDQLGMYHKPGFDAGYYSQQSTNWNRKNDRDCDDSYGRGNSNDRGRDWAATRGNKNGWDKNGKRDNSDRNRGKSGNHGRG